MPERGAHSYPPVGDPDRLDAIVRRGRSLRRRRQLGAAGAGAGGALAVVAVAVLVVGGGSGTPDQMVADDPTTSSTTTTTTTTVPTAPATMTVELLAGPPLQVRVDDPAQPLGDGTQQCLLASAYDPAAAGGALPVAQGWNCARGTSDDGQADVVLESTTDIGAGADQGAGVGPDLGTGSQVEIGCPAAIYNEPVDSTGTQPGATTFSISAPSLPAGQYRVRVEAVSGIGDGCPPEQADVERENVAGTTQVVALP